jgi:hypothetical protein
MVTMVTEKRVLNWREAEAEFDGRWFLLDKKGFPPKDDEAFKPALAAGGVWGCFPYQNFF